MLQSIRDGLQKHSWLKYGVLGSLALIFAAWGAYGLVNFSAGGSVYAAEANGQKVPLESARNAWLNAQSQYQQRLGREIPPAEKAYWQDRILEDLIRRELLTARVRDLGYRVSEQDVRKAIHDNPAFQIEGKYSPEQARDRLAAYGVSLDAYEADLRSDLQRDQLQNGIILSDFQTPAEIRRMRTLQNEQREVRYAMLAPEKYSAAVQVDDAAIQVYYKTHQSQYLTPEYAKLQYAELRLDQLAAQIKPSDADLHAAYDKDKSRYNEPEKRHARHILIPLGKDDAAAQKQAQDVLAQAKGGKDFAALAKQYSQDAGSADKGGDLGWVERSQFVGALSDTLFSMNVGEIRGPVKTEYGYHIVRLDEIQPGKTKTFDEVRPQLEAELKRNAAADKFGEIQEQIQSRLEQGNVSDLGTLAREFNLQTGEVDKFLKGAGGAPLGTAQPIQDIVFGDSPLQPGRVGGPALVGEDRLVLVKVMEHKQPQPTPLAQVRDNIVAALKKERGSADALKAAQASQSKLQAGASFDDIAKQLGVTSTPARFISRTDSTIPVELRDAVFASAKPTGKPVYRAVPLQTGGAAVLAITQLRSEELSGDKAAERIQQQAAQAKQTAYQRGEADAESYAAEVRRTAEVRKNPKAFE